MYYEKKIYDILNESDEYKAKSKETGKVVVFKSKDSYDAAVKGGSHEPLDKPAGDDADKSKGQSVFAKGSDYMKGQNMGKDPDDIDDLSPDAVLGTYGSIKSLTGMDPNDSVDQLDKSDFDDLQYDIATQVADKHGIGTEQVYDYMKGQGEYNTVQDVIDNAKQIGKDYSEIPDDDTDIDRGKSYSGRGFGDDTVQDVGDSKYAGLEGYEASMAKSADEEIAQYGKINNLPAGTDFRTKIADLDKDDVDAFYDDVATEYAKAYDITMGVFDDNKDYFMDEEGMTMSDLVNGIKSSAEEAEAEGGYLAYGESAKPKKQPFRENYNRLFKGRDVL